MALISGTALALALVGLGVVYMQQPVETESAVKATTVADPLAARRAASAAVVAAAQASDRVPADAAVRVNESFASGDGARLLEQYLDVVRRRPEDADAHANLAQLLVRLKRTEEAVPEFERAVALDPQSPGHQFSLGKALAELQRWHDAVASLRKAQQLQPADAATTYALARALHQNGAPAEAVEEYRKVIGLDPNDASVRIALAESYEAIGRRQDASGAYREYLQLAPAGADADRVRLKLSRMTSQPEQAAPPPSTKDVP
jgi:Flp pilus assembly protein TadD